MSESPSCFYRVIDDFSHAFEQDYAPDRLRFSIGNIHTGTNMVAFYGIYMHIMDQVNTVHVKIHDNSMPGERLLRSRTDLIMRRFWW